MHLFILCYSCYSIIPIRISALLGSQRRRESYQKELAGKTRNFHNARWQKNYRGKAPPVDLYYGVPLSRTRRTMRRTLGEDSLSRGPTNNFVGDPCDRDLKRGA